MGTGGATGGAGGLGMGTGGAGGNVDPDLVLHYRFDETAGTTAMDSARTTGSPRNATLNTGGTGGSVAFGTEHKVGTRALNLTPNGNTGGGYATIPSLGAVAPDAVTIAVWVYWRTNTSWTRILDLGTSQTADMMLTPHAVGTTPDSVRFAFSKTTGGTTVEERLNSTAVLPTNAWHHIAIVLPAGSPYTGTLYIDGAVAGTNTAMTMHAGDLGATTNNWLGRSPFTADPYFDGALDDFRVYRRALTATEISAVFAAR